MQFCLTASCKILNSDLVKKRFVGVGVGYGFGFGVHLANAFSLWQSGHRSSHVLENRPEPFRSEGGPEVFKIILDLLPWFAGVICSQNKS